MIDWFLWLIDGYKFLIKRIFRISQNFSFNFISCGLYLNKLNIVFLNYVYIKYFLKMVLKLIWLYINEFLLQNCMFMKSHSQVLIVKSQGTVFNLFDPLGFLVSQRNHSLNTVFVPIVSHWFVGWTSLHCIMLLSSIWIWTRQSVVLGLHRIVFVFLLQVVNMLASTQRFQSLLLDSSALPVMH